MTVKDMVVDLKLLRVSCGRGLSVGSYGGRTKDPLFPNPLFVFTYTALGWKVTDILKPRGKKNRTWILGPSKNYINPFWSHSVFYVSITEGTKVRDTFFFESFV